MIIYLDAKLIPLKDFQTIVATALGLSLPILLEMNIDNNSTHISLQGQATRRIKKHGSMAL